MGTAIVIDVLGHHHVARREVLLLDHISRFDRPVG
jgi:hypothetical protein